MKQQQHNTSYSCSCGRFPRNEMDSSCTPHCAPFSPFYSNHISVLEYIEFYKLLIYTFPAHFSECRFVCYIFFKNVYCISPYISLVGECVCILICLCMPVRVHFICVSFFFFCVELEAREPAIKKRTGTSKGLEAQTQLTC